VFLYVTLGLPAREEHSSNKYCVTVYHLWVDFDAISAVFQVSVRCALHGSHLRCQVAPQFSRNCRQKLRPKIGGKFVRPTSYRQLRDLKKIPPL